MRFSIVHYYRPNLTMLPTANVFSTCVQMKHLKPKLQTGDSLSNIMIEMIVGIIYCDYLRNITFILSHL